MDFIFNPIRDIFEATFKLMPFLGQFMNQLIFGVAFIACIIWIFFMLKYEKTEVPNRNY